MIQSLVVISLHRVAEMRGHAIFVLCNLLLICWPCVDGDDSINVNDFLFSGALEFNDLSHPFSNHTAYWPGARKFSFTKKFAGYINKAWYSANEYCAAEHGGTHLDAPYHFNPHGWTVGEIPFDHLITPLLVVDLSKVVAGNQDFVLQRNHMDNLFHLDSRRNFTVIFRFGWSQYYSDTAKYMGAEHPERFNLKFPGISEDVAKWLVESKNLVGVGVDTASVDPGAELNGLAHRVFTSHNIFLLENVNIEKDLPSNLCSIVVMPMKIQEGSGAPCRLTAICPKLLGQTLF